MISSRRVNPETDSHVRRAILNVTCNSIALYGNPRDMTPRTSSEARGCPRGPHREATCRHVHGDTRGRGRTAS